MYGGMNKYIVDQYIHIHVDRLLDRVLKCAWANTSGSHKIFQSVLSKGFSMLSFIPGIFTFFRLILYVSAYWYLKRMLLWCLVALLGKKYLPEESANAAIALKILCLLCYLAFMQCQWFIFWHFCLFLLQLGIQATPKDSSPEDAFKDLVARMSVLFSEEVGTI